ncbi:homeobox protein LUMINIDEPENDENS-like [Vigna umbellata]|uniref:homeobox protein LUMINIDEPENDENS-like n=1 Tax=Vigna umbellata TaxID=87088 RepID=UPI001F5E43F4|nr:homeobox protein LUMINIDEPENDENS-like [Vigna umbellata]
MRGPKILWSRRLRTPQNRSISFCFRREISCTTRSISLRKSSSRNANSPASTLSLKKWFFSRGGGITLATWLSKTIAKEQTSVLLLILKVLCPLPLHKAIPMHISAILQSVNKLRFYRT